MHIDSAFVAWPSSHHGRTSRTISKVGPPDGCIRPRRNLYIIPPVLAQLMVGEKRLFALIALGLGILAAILILSASTRGPVDVLGLVLGLAVLYGSYLIVRGKSTLLLGWAKTRTGAIINLVIGLVTLFLPGGIGGTASILAIVSGVLGFLAA